MGIEPMRRLTPDQRDPSREAEPNDGTAPLSRADQVIALQRTAGNQAVVRLLTGGNDVIERTSRIGGGAGVLARTNGTGATKKKKGGKKGKRDDSLERDEAEDAELAEEFALREDSEPEDELEAVRMFIENNDGNLGDKLGSGGFGTIYAVPGRSDLVVKIATGSGGAPNKQLKKEAESLTMLGEADLPTAFLGEIAWRGPDGKIWRGLLMRFIVGSFSKQTLQMGKFSTEEPTEKEIAAITHRTVQDLLMVKEKCVAGNLDIEDLQFMISEDDGSIVLIDPARAQKYVESKQTSRRDIKEAMKDFEKRMNGIIRAVTEIANANASKKGQK
jgi:hypothetical protein